MLYKKAKKLIKTGDVLLAAGNWWVSRAIRLMTWEDVSHVGIAVWLTFNGGTPKLCMFESMEGTGVRIVPLYTTLDHEYWSKNGRMWWCSNKDYNGYEVMDYCLEQWGNGYATKYQFAIIMSPTIRRIRKFFGRNLDTSDNKMHCSELVANAFKEQGFKHEKESCLITPGDIGRFSCLGPRILLERSSAE